MCSWDHALSGAGDYAHGVCNVACVRVSLPKDTELSPERVFLSSGYRCVIGWC